MKPPVIEDQFKALGDPVRMRIIRLLALPVRSKSAPEIGFCACDIGTVMGVAQSTVSHHMKVLLNAGLVDSQKGGRWVYYRLNKQAFADLSACFQQFAGDTAGCVEIGLAGADQDAEASSCCEPEAAEVANSPEPNAHSSEEK